MGDVTVWGLVLCSLVITCVANSPPSLSGKIVSRVIAKVGKNTKLLCPAHSDPLLTQWKKNGHALNPGWERFKVSRDGHLKIRDVKLTDAGLYTCVATNGYGSMNINYTVIVLDEANKVFQEADKLLEHTSEEDIYKESAAPVFEEQEKMHAMADLIRPKGSTLRLSCKVKGNPQPRVQWFKDSKLFNQRRSHTSLKINKVTVDHSGKYTCVANNRVGQTNFTFNVQIIDEINQMPKLIAPHPLNQTTRIGGSVSFQCYIESVVAPEVKWLKRVDNPHKMQSPNTTFIKYKKQTLMLWKDPGILQERPDGSFLNKLVIQGVQPQDAGMFVCLATNRKGFVSRHAFLSVRKDFDDEDQISLYKGSSSSKDSSSEAKDTSPSSEDKDIHLLLLIGVPMAVVLVIILLVVFLFQRNNWCKKSSTNNKVPRAPVPPAEREAYYYSNCQQHHLQQSVNPLLYSRDKLPKTPTPSVDMTGSEFSSVSRSHYPHQHHFYSHNNHNFGY